jgi:hypothetical protein
MWWLVQTNLFSFFHFCWLIRRREIAQKSINVIFLAGFTGHCNLQPFDQSQLLDLGHHSRITLFLTLGLERLDGIMLDGETPISCAVPLGELVVYCLLDLLCHILCVLLVFVREKLNPASVHDRSDQTQITIFD